MAGLHQSLRDLYKFDGSHPARWIAQMENCFRLYYIKDEEAQLSMGKIHLDNERRQWWQEHQCGYGRFLTWDAFKKALMDHFDRKANFVDKLTQTDTQPSKDLIFTEKKESMEPKGLFPTGISILQIHGLIQKEKIIVSINPSCKHNFIRVNLTKKLQVPAKQIEHTQVDDKDVQIYKDLKLSMDKYVLHGDFCASEMDNMDVVLGYPWMESVGTININVQKKFLKLWYKKKKITLQDISIHKQVEHMEAEAEDVQETDILDDEPLMINTQTQTEVAEEKAPGDDTSEEGPVVEVILKKKPPQQAPQQGEVKKKPSWVKTSTYHHPHHPARQPSRWKPSCHMTDCEERRSTHCTSTQKSCHGQLPSQASEAPVRSRVHLSLGWLDARAWYQWTTLLSRSYYLCSSHVSGTKHA